MATAKLSGLYLPPMVKMQLFVFFFDLVVLMYYVYQNPFWDSLKAKFPALAYEWKSNQAPDCSTVFILCFGILMSKVNPTTFNTSVGTRDFNDPNDRG